MQFVNECKELAVMQEKVVGAKTSFTFSHRRTEVRSQLRRKSEIIKFDVYEAFGSPRFGSVIFNTTLVECEDEELLSKLNPITVCPEESCITFAYKVAGTPFVTYTVCTFMSKYVGINKYLRSRNVPNGTQDNIIIKMIALAEKKENDVLSDFAFEEEGVYN